MLVASLLSLVVVGYNNLINRWGPFHGAAYVPVNLLVASAVAAAGAITMGLSTAELGLRGNARDLLLPLALVAVVGSGAFALALSGQAHRIADQRVAGMSSRDLAWYVTVRIPLGTAVTEELIFRGVLLAAWREAGLEDPAAAVTSSVMFGLWHISPTLIGLEMNDPIASRKKRVATVAGAVALTTLAGLLFIWLRLESEGLLAPIALHAGVNSVAALAAATAHRRAGTP